MKKTFLFIFFSYWIFFFLLPPFQAPDEQSHFDATYWIAKGIYPYVTYNVPTNQHPGERQQALFKDVILHDSIIPNFEKIKKSDVQRRRDYSISEKAQFAPIAGQAYNSPLYYFTAAGMLLLAQFLHANLLTQVYFVRFTSGLFYFGTVVAAYNICILLFKKKQIAQSFTLLFALNPLVLQSSTSISPDISPAFFAALFFFYIIKLNKNILKIQSLILLGLIVGAACLARITGIILIPGLAIYLYIQTKNVKKSIKSFLIFFLVVLSTQIPWFILNFIRYKTPVMAAPAFGAPITNGHYLSPLSAVIVSMWGFRHTFMHYSGFLGFHDVYPFSPIFIAYTILFIISFFIGIISLWKSKIPFYRLAIVIVAILFLLLFSLDISRKILSHQNWETGGKNALLIFLPMLLFSTQGIAVIVRRKIEDIAPFLGYFSIWYYYFILIFVLIPRYYV
ncbi:MAG TPA: glycosyltransferase family 39 protein [Candidatus Eisenbacteria bacterium]|nr:glycosyltransferase family 39 protein [Candidatus Eisenbacteria bacterium]